jgi:prepilin-type N-terminal cleavage/methylation domain-containing protein
VKVEDEKMNKLLKSVWNDNKGYTLLEVMLVLIIISILAMIAFSGFSVYIEKARDKVYKVNCLQLERMYNIYLLTESEENSEESFNKFMQEHKEISYPLKEVITYRDGKIYYSMYSGNDSENNISNDNDFNENDDNESYINENIVNENENNDESIENDNYLEDIYNENIENENNSNEDANNESDANEKEICNNNCLALEEGYNYYLMENTLEHTENLFIQYMQGFMDEICPSKGAITYTNGKVRCSIHSEEDANEDNNASFL